MAQTGRNPDSPPDPVPGTTDASVIARWDDHRLLLQLPSGATVTVSVPPAERAGVDVGQIVRVVVGSDGTVHRWDPAES